MAAEELSHLELAEQMVDGPDLPGHPRAGMEPPATLSDFGAYGTLPLKQDDLSVAELLSAAEARELIAREHSGYLAELAPEGPVQGLFRLLCDEEDRHVTRIGARWSALFSIL